MTRVVAVVPAHDEAAGIAASVTALCTQTRRPEQVWVVADSCTDDTASLAAAAGAATYATVGNADKKAGALNQLLDLLLPVLEDTDLVLVADADSVLAPEFIATAVEHLEDAGVGAVGGVFQGEPGGGLLGLLQRMEYGRYARELARSGKVWVLTGTATMHRVSVLREVAASRGTRLPGVAGDVYDRDALTEDMEITIAIKQLGYRLASPAGCRVTTEVMRTWRDLFRQRLRWQRGALENLRAYGRRSVTRPYLRQQALMSLGIVAMALYLAYTAMLATTGRFGFSPFWTGVAAIFLLERLVTAWRVGWAARAVAAVLVLDLLYDVFQQSVIVRAAWDSLLRRPQEWRHATDGRR